MSVFTPTFLSDVKHCLRIFALHSELLIVHIVVLHINCYLAATAELSIYFDNHLTLIVIQNI